MEYGLGFVWVIIDMLAIDTNCINELGSNPLPDEIQINYTNFDSPEDRAVGELGHLFGSPSVEWMGSKVSRSATYSFVPVYCSQPVDSVSSPPVSRACVLPPGHFRCPRVVLRSLRSAHGSVIIVFRNHNATQLVLVNASCVDRRSTRSFLGMDVWQGLW